MHEKTSASRSSIAPLCDSDSRPQVPECIVIEERSNWPSIQTVQAAVSTVWNGDSLAAAVSDILGPHARKEWNLPVGSHKNYFWKYTRKVSSPHEINKLLTKTLTLVCSMGSAALVKNLLETGAEPNGVPGKWGPLHSAAYTGNVEVMRVLLEDSRTDVNTAEDKGKAALHIAARKGNHEVLKLLLESSKIKVNATDETGNTALHIAGSSPLLGEVPAERFVQCITLLMNRSDVKLNIPNKEGLTPLGQAVMLFREEMVNGMLKHSKRQYLNVDYSLAGYYNTTVRDAITNTYPELATKLPKPLQENQESPIIANRLLAFLQKGDFNSFQSVLKHHKQPFNINHFYDEPYHCSIIEIACQMKDRLEFISLLLRAGANPNTINPLTSQSLLHLTAKRGNQEELKLLLRMKETDVNIKDSYSRTPLHCLSGVKCQNKTDATHLQNSINILLEYSDSLTDNGSKVDINAVTCNGETPLHIAARMGEKETILTLLRHGADIMQRTVYLKPPITYIDPEILKSYLDECIESNEYSPMQEDYMLTFDYRFLCPNKENRYKKNDKRDSEMSTLKYFSKKERFRHLLKHPVISSFLELKWNKVRFVYFTSFIIYSIFLAVLTWHCVLPDKTKESALDSIIPNKTKESASHSILPNKRNESDEYSLQHKISLGILSTVLVFMCLGQLFQFLQFPKIYLSHSPNWLLWIVIIMTINVCLDTVIKMIPQCTSIALLLAWTHFVSLIGGFPRLSIPLEMLNTVSWTFFTFIICYFPLFLAYGICFYTMFRYSESKKDEFFTESFGMSLLKTFIMFAGEFEASDIPFEAAQMTSHIVFTIFVFLISIVLLNLLNGLAVSDTQTIRKDAEILSLSARIKHIYYIEKMVYNKTRYFSVFEKLKDRKLSIYPNRKSGKIEVNGTTIKNRNIDEDTIQQAVTIAQMKNPTISDSTIDNHSDMEKKLFEIEKHQEDINKKINEITKQLDFLRQESKDSNTKLNDILAIIKTSGFHSGTR